MTRWKLALLALAGVGLLSFGAFSFVGSSAAPKPSAGGQGNGQANGHRDFVVSGQVEDLRPGGAQPMVLTVRNPNRVGIRVTTLTVRAGAASAGCPASSLTLPQWSGSLLVPKNGTATLTVNVTLRSSAPDACQGARWPLSYGGTAVKA
jgi:hypothetical protein